MTAERADDQPAILNRLAERLPLALVCQEFGRVAVCVARIRAGADLDRADPQLFQVVEGFFERLVAEQNRKNADTHG